ncbi:gastrula zinc finger protein XlCGF7.1 isoform X2 [Cryptotermes secundus]|nr:gastrula zinc finger protein XlCGF7.1 isoform X2 [Cryptotermes secundus]XP_023723535.1 gastrula zinc finger protein XlCGF7.1 isoform X2 [Cryptotermes secundus]XP_023723542.1 gastrula zinc finger protein XlCGF7.1 isoform X2 [Cryptotermes secundus]XP_033610987.1 gastrula zinc finger protein XlCGF7.1 isoform X2 [Cryptotermes secundus]
MASSVKRESEPDNEVDPLSTHNEHEVLDIKQEKYLEPVVMTETEFITSDIKPQPDSDDDAPLPSLGHGELFEMILDESPASIITDQPENIPIHVCEHDHRGSSQSSKRTHVCAFCGKSFNRKQHLTDHTRMHTQERPYTCDLCKKSFSRKGYLKIHLRLHSGHQPFSCKICSKSFNQKSQLETHVFEHTGGGPYLCDICDEAFSDRINLILHQGVHSAH